MRQVFSNAVILEGERLEVTRGHLVVEGGEIKEISEGSPSGRATDLKGGIVMPPLVNAHTHVGDAAGKELYVGKTQPEVVGPRGVKFEVLKSSPENSISSMKSSLQEILRSGTIAHCDFREGGAEGIKLLKKAMVPPLRSLALGRGKDLAELKKVLKVADGIGMSSIVSADPKTLSAISKEAKADGKFFSLHVSETGDGQKTSLEETGKGEVERALELEPSFLIHATNCSIDELKILKKKKVPVVFCPRANQLLSVGVPPIAGALELGAEFWIGTDNVMVAQPDMFEELRFAWACLRKENKKAGAEEARRLLIAATVSPVKTFSLEGGAIRQGGEATFLILSRKTNLQDVSNLHAGIVNRGRVDNIRSLFVAGKAIF